VRQIVALKAVERNQPKPTISATLSGNRLYLSPFSTIIYPENSGRGYYKNKKSVWLQRRRRISEIIEAGSADDPISRGYDIFSTLMTVINVAVTVLYTFDKMELNYGAGLLAFEAMTVGFFAVEYILRLWTVQFIYPNLSEPDAIKKYATSFTGIIDQYSRLKKISEHASEEDVHFIKGNLKRNDNWVGRMIMELGLPHGVIVAMIRRGGENIVPRGNVVLKPGDTLILGAEGLKDGKHIDLKDVILRKHNPWNGLLIRDLDISRQTIIVMVKRNGTVLVPKGDLMLPEGDHVILYSQERISGASTIQV